MSTFSFATWDSTWWSIMVCISTINFLAGALLFAKSFKLKRLEPENAKYFLFLRITGAIFLCVAFYRTIFVSSYPSGLAWFDTILNSPFIIRSMAFCAELSFNGMIAVILHRFVRETRIDEGRKHGKLLAKSPLFAFGCIVLAQFFAFGGLITQFMTLFAIEETLWAIAFISIAPLVFLGLKRTGKRDSPEKGFKAFFIVMAIWCVGYVAFQLFYSLPFTHFALVAQDAGKSIPQDALYHSIFSFTATRDYDAWGGIGFFIWHSGYFSLCAWMALLFMTAPRSRKGLSERG